MITFREHMDQTLYGPAGYYSSGVAKSGREGDYFTAPDVGEAFGQLLAEIFLAWEKKLGAPNFSIIEAGAGEGRLARDILSSFRRKPESTSSIDPGVRRGDVKYIAVERSAVRRSFLERLRTECPTLEIHPTLKSAGVRTGVLFANELIDAFPVHRVQFQKGKLRELFVDGSGERRRFVWKDPSTPALEAYFKRLGIQLPDGYETEVNLAMEEWLKEASDMLQKGILLLIDYGRPAREYYLPERARGTLRAFSKHKVSADFLDPAGTVDLTADVDFTSLALYAREAGFVPLAYMEMGSFLLLGASSMTSAPRGLKYLIHPEGMGSAFHVLVLGKDVSPNAWAFEHNRIARLDLP